MLKYLFGNIPSFYAFSVKGSQIYAHSQLKGKHLSFSKQRFVTMWKHTNLYFFLLSCRFFLPRRDVKNMIIRREEKRTVLN